MGAAHLRAEDAQIVVGDVAGIDGDGHAGGGHADEDDRAGARGHGEGLRDGRLGADGDEDVVGAAAGQAAHLLDGVGRAGVHAVGGAEAAGGLQLALDEIERDHHAGAGNGGALHGVQADAAGADDDGGARRDADRQCW